MRRCRSFAFRRRRRTSARGTTRSPCHSPLGARAGGRGDRRLRRRVPTWPAFRTTGRTSASGRSRRSTRPTAFSFTDPLRHPGGRGARLERCGAVPAPWRPTTCTSSTPRSSSSPPASRAIPTTSGPRSSAGRDLRRGGAGPLDPAPGSRGCSRSRPTRSHRGGARRAARRGPAARRGAQRGARGAPGARPRARRPGPGGRGLADRVHQPYRERLYPRSIELLRRARELGAVGASISGAGPASSSGPTGSTPAIFTSRCARPCWTARCAGSSSPPGGQRKAL